MKQRPSHQNLQTAAARATSAAATAVAVQSAARRYETR